MKRKDENTALIRQVCFLRVFSFSLRTRLFKPFSVLRRRREKGTFFPKNQIKPRSSLSPLHDIFASLLSEKQQPFTVWLLFDIFEHKYFRGKVKNKHKISFSKSCLKKSRYTSSR